MEFALDDPITATVTIRDLCYAPGVELLDVTATYLPDFTYDQGVFDISNVLDSTDASMELSVPRFQNSDVTVYTEANGDAYSPA